MSYCVNCGVELSEKEKRCPLCDTIVLNPRTIGVDKGNDMLNNDILCKERESISQVRVDFRLLSSIISVLFVVPVAVTFICNYVAVHKLTWSLYVLGATVLIFVTAFLPAFFKLKRPYGYIAVDSLALFLFLSLISELCNGGWIISLALPLCIMSMVFAMFYAMVIRNKKVNKLLKVNIFILFTGIYTLAVEIVINDALNKPMMLNWSHYVLIPCAAVSIVLLIIDSQKKLKEELRKKLFM